MRKHSYIPFRRDLKAKARILRREQTPAEKRIWQHVLSRRQLCGYRFVRQKPIGAFIADFVSFDLSLIVEIDGETHVNQQGYDGARTRSLERFGFAVVRYTNADIMSNLEAVYDDLVRIARDRPVQRRS